MSVSKNTLREHDLAWKAIRKSCVGCWSGSMGKLQKDGSLFGFGENGEVLNFRLQVAMDRSDTGTWTVWNLIKQGDKTVVPVMKIPRSKQLKFGFPSENLILRIPGYISNDLPRMVWEIGFWDGDVRRTAVIEYKKSRVAWSLKDATVVQMMRKDSRTFVGNTSDDQAVRDILPSLEPLVDKMTEFVTDTSIHWKIVHSEAVDVTTMERTPQSVKDHHLGVGEVPASWGQPESQLQVLPNGIAMIVPQRVQLRKGDSRLRCIFASPYWNKKDHMMRAVVVEYERNGDESAWRVARVVLQTFCNVLQKPAIVGGQSLLAHVSESVSGDVVLGFLAAAGLVSLASMGAPVVY